MGPLREQHVTQKCFSYQRIRVYWIIKHVGLLHWSKYHEIGKT